jgi:hypothetical protein
MKIVSQESGGSATKLQALYPSMEAFSAVSILASNDAQTFTEKLGSVQDAAGVTTEQFKRMADEPAFRMKQARAAFETSSIAMGQSVMSITAPIATVGAAILGFIAQHQWLANAIAFVGGTAGTALLAVSGFIRIVTTARAASEAWGVLREFVTRMVHRETAAELENAAAKVTNADASGVAGAADLARGRAALASAANVRAGGIGVIGTIRAVVAAGGMGAAAILGSVALATAAIVGVTAAGVSNISELWGAGRQAFDQSHADNVTHNRYFNAQRDLRKALGREPTIEEIAQYDPQAINEGQRENLRKRSAIESMRSMEGAKAQQAAMEAEVTAQQDALSAATASTESGAGIGETYVASSGIGDAGPTMRSLSPSGPITVQGAILDRIANAAERTARAVEGMGRSGGGAYLASVENPT